MEHPKTTKNVGQPCVICGQPANAQATVEALQAAANYYKQPSKNGGVYSVSGGHIGNLMDWCKDNLAHCKFSGPDEDNLDLDLVQTAQQIPQLKTELSALQGLVRALQRERDAAVHDREIYQKLYGNSCMDRGVLRNANDELQAALDAEREKVARLDAMYRQQLGDRDKRIDALAGSAKIWMDKLSQLKALVRALPVAIAVHVDCSIERYVRYCTSEKLNYECAFPSKKYAQAFAKLLEYRATLDATTPEEAT